MINKGLIFMFAGMRAWRSWRAEAGSAGPVAIRAWLGPLLLALACVPALASCRDGAAEPEKTTASASISPYNHTGDHIAELYVNDQWGGNSRAYGGGGSFVCCIVYPRQWQPGLTATVRWATSDANPNGSPGRTWHEKVVPIERYVRTGTTLNVHFLPDNDVRLLITNMSAGHADYPGPPPPEAPDKWPPWRHEAEPVPALEDLKKGEVPLPPVSKSSGQREK